MRLQARDAAGLVGPFSPARRVRIGAVVRDGFGGGLMTSDGAPAERLLVACQGRGGSR